MMEEGKKLCQRMSDGQNEDCEHWAEGAHRLRHVGISACADDNRRALTTAEGDKRLATY